jgi:uncharacterized integral membrane protein
MTDDPTRATARRTHPPAYGRVGPADPHEDPVTHPRLRRPDPATGPGLHPVAVSEGSTVPIRRGPETHEQPTVPTPRDHEPRDHERRQERPLERHREPVVARSRTGVLWTGLVLSALVLLFLLIFIMQNTAPVRITFLWASGTLPTGVALLLAAIAGLLLIAIPGGLRILQLRRAARGGARRVS